MERKKTNSHKPSSTSPHLLHNPSFSSSLLDSIYRSIDEEGGGGYKVPDEMVSYKGLTLTARKNRSAGCSFREKEDEEEGSEVKVNNDFRRIEKWVMEKRRSSEKAAFASRKSSSAVLSSSNSNSSSSSSSSDSSFWSGGLSSSESEYSFYGPKSVSSSSSSCYPTPRPKLVRTERNANASLSQKSKKRHDHEEVFAKTKSKALKIYAELKKAKAKQPISPGGKLASFVNSLFANLKKKPKIVLETLGGNCDESTRVNYSKSKSAPSYDYPSSASSYSRSCLSKTPSSGVKMNINNGTKRSVRFDPVSVIVGEDSQPCGRKNLPEEDGIHVHALEENRRVAEAARKLLESYRRTKYDPKTCHDDLSEDDEENEDGASSCSSSDLFELDNLCAMGIERYREELPVYETTHVGTNRAIASGLLL
ncbi:protein BIG GRAIN 1-like A [Punica granatum]|uniref:Uncharacterized protein n=2 Tax=Punica granatum TaxID=22663 RepID=A0A218X687_PUNGR|nr:protein BIG GRAIN 1-like A [Punica granatum]OWM79891.1 hypothetical protein CDL15_Pgr001534 [Punica granatum]OWM79892.1 hypothetical protein CDL15_Pgr001535 [Punica granatum]OWM79893.1 hypothetical protein CDL15_Pgr001536 [Punica granatum]PKI39890.1 hypothetical protein CRG98_039730 [Punica granatum]